MALDLSTDPLFVGRITAADAAYPYASSKDESVPGANDGTQYIKKRADDLFGFLQSLLVAGGVAPNGNPDSVANPQYLQALGVLFGDMGLEWHTGLKMSTLNEFIFPQGVNIGAGAVMDDTRTVRITLPAGISKNLALPWAEGPGYVGGRAAADAHTALTCYGCFILAKADGTPNLILATSRANALADPNVIAAGYIYARLVSAVYTGTFALFNQFVGQGYYEDGNGLQRYNVPVLLTQVISTAGLSITSRVPPNMIGLFSYTITTETTGVAVDGIVGGVLSNPALVNQAPSPIVNHVSTNVNHIVPLNRDSSTSEFEFKVDNLANVRHRENTVNNATFMQLFIRGWRMDWSETDII